MGNEIDLDELFEDENFKGCDENIKSLFKKIFNNKASSLSFENLKSSEKSKFLVSLADGLKTCLKGGTKTTEEMTQRKKIHFEKILNFMFSSLEDEHNSFIINLFDQDFIFNTKILEHSGFIKITNKISLRKRR